MTPPRKPRVVLNERQEEYLYAVSEGLTNAEAGELLGVSASAVNKQVRVLRGLFGVEHKRQLIQCARKYWRSF